MIEAVWVFAFVVGVGALIAKLLAVRQMAKIAEGITTLLLRCNAPHSTE